MTETPTAAVAAPVAPVAPVAAPVAPVASVAVPAAVVAPVVPPVAPVAPAAPAPAESLLPAEPPVAPVVAQTDAEKIAAADPNSGKAWLWTDGVMGTGEKPGWFDSSKYKNVAEQAKAYPELSKRFGSFVGAPKDGKYSYTPPDGVEVNMDHPMMTEFTKWAGTSQLSQAGFENMMGMLVQYEAANAPKMADIKARLGEKADERIAAVATWGKANLGPEGYAALRQATTGKEADAVIRVFEQMIGKTAQARMPKADGDVTGGQPADGLAAVNAAMAVRMPDGKLKIHVDPKYRAECDKRYQAYFAAQGQ